MTENKIYKIIMRRKLNDEKGLCALCPPHSGCNVRTLNGAFFYLCTMIANLTTLLQEININFLGEVMTLRDQSKGEAIGTITNGQEALVANNNYISAGIEFVSDIENKNNYGKFWKKRSRWNLICMKAPILITELENIYFKLQDKENGGFVYNILGSQRISENQIIIQVEITYNYNYDPRCLCCD